MDYLEGINLASLLDSEKRVEVPRAVDMFLQMSSALAHAHSKDIIHRDVKPSNIMLVEFEGRKDFVKLVDFGIAKVLNPANPEAENLTRTGEVFGSPLYMSPEQCKGMKLDARADIYSLGAVMYRVVTGKSIFSTTDPLETMFKQVSEMPLGFKDVCPDCEIPDKLEAVIFKCLEKERENRYQTMSDLRADLQLVANEMRPLQRQTGSINTLRLEDGKPAAKAALPGDDWLSDLSENTGALQITPSFLNVQLEDVAKTVVTTGGNLAQSTTQNTAQNTAPNKGPNIVSNAVPITIPLSPFSGMVSSTAAANNSSAATGNPASTAAASQSVSPPRFVADKKEDTISIVVNKKSVTLGGVALAVLLAIAGFLTFKPSGPATAPPAGTAVKVQNESPNASSAKAAKTSPIPQAITASNAHAEKKTLPAKKKPPKHKQYRNPYAQDYYPQAGARAPYPTIGSSRTAPYPNVGSSRNVPYPTIGAPVAAPPEAPVSRAEPVASPPSYSGNAGYGRSTAGDSVRAVTGAGRLFRKVKNGIRGIINEIR